MKRRNFFTSLARAAAIVALAPQVVGRSRAATSDWRHYGLLPVKWVPENEPPLLSAPQWITYDKRATWHKRRWSNRHHTYLHVSDAGRIAQFEWELAEPDDAKERWFNHYSLVTYGEKHPLS